MMTSMKRKVAAVLAAVSLMTVATGALADYGDLAKDSGTQSRYQVGQEVEVYNTGFHVTTRRKKIVAVQKSDKTISRRMVIARKGCWRYRVRNFDGSYEWISADHIQS